MSFKPPLHHPLSLRVHLHSHLHSCLCPHCKTYQLFRLHDWFDSHIHAIHSLPLSPFLPPLSHPLLLNLLHPHVKSDSSPIQCHLQVLSRTPLLPRLGLSPQNSPALSLSFSSTVTSTHPRFNSPPLFSSTVGSTLSPLFFTSTLIFRQRRNLSQSPLPTLTSPTVFHPLCPDFESGL